jgi:hypothetical protein
LSKNVKIRIYKTIILPVVLYGCETWSLTLREKHKLRVFENRVLRRIFGPKRDEMTGGWRKLHNEVLNKFYSLPSITSMIGSRSEMGRECRSNGHRHIGYWWENLKEGDNQEDEDSGGWIILRWILETRWGGMDWIDQAQGRDQWRDFMNKVMNLWVP